MASPCTVDGCGVVLSIEGPGPNQGKLRADLDDTISHLEAGVVPTGGGGWVANLADLGAFPVGVPVTVAEDAGPNTFENESDCHTYNVMSVVAGREVLYTGNATAQFRVTYEVDIDGGGYQTMFVYSRDYRWPATPAGGISDGVPGGGSVDGRVLPAGGSFTYRYRIQVTNLVAPGAGPAVVGSPGFTFCHHGTID